MKKALEEFLRKFEAGEDGEILVSKEGAPEWIKGEKVVRREAESEKGLQSGVSDRKE